MGRDVAERRENPRFPAVFDLQGEPASGGDTARMQAADLSLGGLRCTSTTEFAEMTQLAVRMMLPVDGNGETEPLDVKAVVVRSQPLPSPTNGGSRYELALFFTGLETEDRERIAAFLDR